MDVSIVFIIIQLIVLEGLLSIDNAAVLGAMVAHLPDHKPIRWPRSLQKLGDRLHPLLGNQRTAALRVGLLGAYLGRGLMLLIVSLIVQNPWLKIIGAFYLIRLAFDNLGQAEMDEDDPHTHPASEQSFWHVVLTIEVADLIFSLDNVVAAVSLSDQLWVVMLGVALGIVFMRFAAGLFSYAVQKEPVLKQAAYMLVFNIGVELLLEELAGIHISDWLRFAISLGTIAFALGYAHSKVVRLTRPLVLWIGQGFANLNEVFDWLLVPFAALFKWIVKLFPKHGPEIES